MTDERKKKIQDLWSDLLQLAYAWGSYVDGDNDCDEKYIAELEKLDEAFEEVFADEK